MRQKIIAVRSILSQKANKFLTQHGLDQKKTALIALAVLVMAIPLSVLAVTTLTTALPRATSTSITPPTPPTPTPTPTLTGNRVFVTSSEYNGNLGGAAGGDTKCQESVDAVGLGGTWKAWLSEATANGDANSRLHHSQSPYKLLDGSIIANNWTDLTDQTLSHPINLTETGQVISEVPNYWNVWTNTWTNGTVYDTQPSLTCNNWNSASSTMTGRGGSTTETNYKWTASEFSGHPCNSLSKLYCFEQPPTPTLVPTLTPTPTPALIGCNQPCNPTIYPPVNCKAELTCWVSSLTSKSGVGGICRNPNCLEEKSCVCKKVTPTPDRPTATPTTAKPTPTPPPQYHTECQVRGFWRFKFYQCVRVSGPGPNQCQTSRDCR